MGMLCIFVPNQVWELFLALLGPDSPSYPLVSLSRVGTSNSEGLADWTLPPSQTH